MRVVFTLFFKAEGYKQVQCLESNDPTYYHSKTNISRKKIKTLILV